MAAKNVALALLRIGGHPMALAQTEAPRFAQQDSRHGERWEADAEGSSEGLFRVTERVAWLFGVGGNVPIRAGWDVVFRLQYRICYYTTRGGEALRDSVAQGTQSITPLVGVAFHR